MSNYIESDNRTMSDAEYDERANADAHRASHVACHTCDLPACLVGELGLTDDCRDDELGIRVGKDVVHLGPCKAAYHAWTADSRDTVKRAQVAFRYFKGSLLTRTVASYIAAMTWIEFPSMAKGDVEELCYPASNLIRGQLITEEMVKDRANQIASVILSMAEGGTR